MSSNKNGKPKYTYRYAKHGVETPVVLLVIALIVVIIVLSAILVSKLVDEGDDVTESDSDSIEQTTEAEQAREPTVTDNVTQSGETEVPVPDGYKTVNILNSQISQGDLVLVNYQHSYDDDSIDKSDLVGLYGNNSKKYSLAYSDLRLLTSAYNALNNMTDDYYKTTGKTNLQLTQAYKTYDEQEKYYNDSVENVEDRKYYEKAGYSDHQTGLGFNVKLFEDGVSMPYAKNAQEHAKWIADNLHKYGFVIRYLPEKYEITGIYDESSHFRYVGVPHSYYMTNKNLCLDEYISKIKQYTLDKGVLEVDCDGEVYCVYYVKASDDNSTEVCVPADKEYEISGNNVDGFIVWFKK